MEFKTNWMTDAQIEVEDVDAGHVWTFTFAQAPTGERVLSSGHQRSIDHIAADWVAMRARRYAERAALQVGKIDRSTCL